MNGPAVAFLLGLLQGVLEWLPVSSEGAVAVAGTFLAGVDPADATRLGLVLHAGTALAATAFYRDELRALGADARGLQPRSWNPRSLQPRSWNPRSWQPRSAFDDETADLSFLLLATVASACVGIPAYLALEAAVDELTGGAFVALVGGLLVLTGLVQRAAGAVDLARRQRPDLVDALLVGALQGLAILPGVSRSGTTVSALLLRGHRGERALDLSFLLSIPAALGAAGIALADGGLPALGVTEAAIALVTSAVVGYATVGALVALARRVAFWVICVGFGGLAVVGGLLLVL